jgi:hypothetical protein
MNKSRHYTPLYVTRHATLTFETLTLTVQYTTFLHLNLTLQAFLPIYVVVPQLVRHTHPCDMITHCRVVAFEDRLKLSVFLQVFLLDRAV